MTALLFIYFTSQYGLPEGLLSSLCYVESKHKIAAIHFNDGQGHSIGICQIKYKTAKHMGFKGSEKDLILPENNIKYAAIYLKHQIKRYNSVTKGIIAYNQGHAGMLTSTNYSVKVYKQWRQDKCLNLAIK